MIQSTMLSFSKLALLCSAVAFVSATPTPTTPQEPSLTKRDFTSNQPTGAFTGTPESGIGSWYRSDNAQDYTNGKSWCGYAYYDDSPLFAPVSTGTIHTHEGDRKADGLLCSPCLGCLPTVQLTPATKPAGVRPLTTTVVSRRT